MCRKFNTDEGKIRGYVISKLSRKDINAIGLKCFETKIKDNVIKKLFEEDDECYKPSYSVCLIKQKINIFRNENEKDDLMDDLKKLTQLHDGFGVVGFNSNSLEAAIVFPCPINEVKDVIIDAIMIAD